MNELMKVFNNKDLGIEIRTVMINGEPHFVAVDITNALGYGNGRQAVATHVDEEDKGVCKVTTLGGLQTVTIINESGMYALVFGSQLPTAKKVKHWITSEVMPSIRKLGGYMVVKEEETAEQLMARALVLADDTLRRQKEQLKEKDHYIATLEPKVSAFNHCINEEDTIDIRGLADTLNLTLKDGRHMGRNIMFGLLQAEGLLDYNNRPYSDQVKAKHFKTVLVKNDRQKTVAYKSAIPFLLRRLKKYCK